MPKRNSRIQRANCNTMKITEFQGFFRSAAFRDIRNMRNFSPCGPNFPMSAITGDGSLWTFIEDRNTISHITENNI
jgi:hypothetical protein